MTQQISLQQMLGLLVHRTNLLQDIGAYIYAY